MPFNKILSVLKKVLIGYCFFLFLLETIMFFFFEPHAPVYYFGYLNQITIYFLLIAILVVKKKWMWRLGLAYFIYGTIDLLFIDISYSSLFSCISRRESSNASSFEFSRLIYRFIYELNGFQNSYALKIVHVFGAIIGFGFVEMLVFPFVTLLFFTNYIRKHYGLSPFFASKKPNLS